MLIIHVLLMLQNWYILWILCKKVKESLGESSSKILTELHNPFWDWVTLRICLLAYSMNKPTNKWIFSFPTVHFIRYTYCKILKLKTSCISLIYTHAASPHTCSGIAFFLHSVKKCCHHGLNEHFSRQPLEFGLSLLILLIIVNQDLNGKVFAPCWCTQGNNLGR